MAIQKMKHVRMLAMQADRERLLHQLQQLGCVEVNLPRPDDADDAVWQALTQPDGQALAVARDAHATLSTARDLLQRYAPHKAGLLSRRPTVQHAQLFDDATYAASLQHAREIVQLEKRLTANLAEQAKLQQQKRTLAPWLSLDMPLDTPATAGVVVQLGTLSQQVDFATLTAALADLTDLAQLSLVSGDRELQYMVVISHKSVAEDALDLLKSHGFARAALQGFSGTAAACDMQLNATLAQRTVGNQALQEEMTAYAQHRGQLLRSIDRADQEIAREQAKSNLLDSQSTFFLEGWVTAEDEPKLAEALRSYPCCWQTEAPTEDEYAEVPIQLKSNVLTEPLTTITAMYSLPAYNGVDPNGLMMPFYVFFFGFMFADLGYGLILAGLCGLIQYKTRPKGGFGQLVRLMMMCGVASAVIGLFTGGFFSDFITRFCGLMEWPVPQIPFLTYGAVLDVMNDPLTALIFSLAIGFLQILVGMAVQFWLLCRDGKVWDAIWDVGTWWMIFAGIGLAAVGVTNIVLYIGLLMLLGQARKGTGAMRLVSIVAAIYNGATGYFGDILSYSRLMVMMLAGSVIGQVFNILGAMPGESLPKPVAAIIFFIIFLIGHSFNMGLNVIGTYVHTSRLQYLEYFKQFYREGGRAFRPLNIQTTYVDIQEEK